MANSPLGTVLSRLRTILEPANAEATDRELLRRFVAGCDQAAFGEEAPRVAMLGTNASILASDQAAFGELVRRHGPMVLGVCRRLLGDAHAAEDAFQAVFLVLVRRARAVPWRESLGGWLHGTARRVALRAKARAGRGFDAGRAPAPSASPDPSEEAAARELRRVLDQELQGLPAKYRAPLVLCDMEGKTHEQAARELGWPKGSLAKRLNGAREQLRARLVRRGVTLSAGALAVFTANEVTAAPSAALAAAAMLAAEGGASTTATALAQGVIQAMWFTKVKTAAVLLLALAVAGTLAGLGAYRAWGARAAAPAPEAKPSPAPAEDKMVMPIDKAVVYNVGFAQAGEAFLTLSEGAAAVADRPEDVKANVQLFLSAVEENRKRVLSVPAGPRLALLAVGPPLDFGDVVAAVGLTRRGGKLDLEMAYTSGRAEGKEFRRNVPWRPLVQVPVDLAPGRYQLTVTWQARKALPAGDAWNVPPTVSTCEFAVTGGDRRESKAVRANGAEFTAFITARLPAPPRDGARDVEIGLRIANVSDHPVMFNRMDTVALSLTAPDGKAREWRYERLRSRQVPPVQLDAGKDVTIPFNGRLTWSDDGKTMRLGGTDDSAGHWWFDGLLPGKYLLTADYENTAAADSALPVRGPYWRGKVQAEPVAFEILEAPNASKPVRVEGLEFTALAPARVAVPPAGQTADVDLGLRIVNVSDKPIALEVNDVLNPRLVAPNGKEPLKPDVGRDGSPRPRPPVTLAPGDSWTWRPEARLQWTTDRAALQLCGPDGRGVPGFWCFGTLHAGKYGLIVGYSNSVAKQDDVAVWVGKAMTEPVDFEIAGP